MSPRESDSAQPRYEYMEQLPYIPRVVAQQLPSLLFIVISITFTLLGIVACSSLYYIIHWAVAKFIYTESVQFWITISLWYISIAYGSKLLG